jgi:hypothetical protein
LLLIDVDEELFVLEVEIEGGPKAAAKAALGAFCEKLDRLSTLPLLL